MPDEDNTNSAKGDKAKLEYAETQPPRNDLKEQRGGSQSDQRVGQKDEGAHNQKMMGRNPQGTDSRGNRDGQK